MAWVNRRKSGSEQCDKRRLRPLKLERHFLFAVDDHIIEVAVPGLPRVEAELVLRLALQQLKRALDVLGRERFAVMPFDALAQFKRQVFAVLAPRPAFAKVGNDRLQASITAGFQTDCTFPSVIRSFIPRYFNLTGSP